MRFFLALSFFIIMSFAFAQEEGKEVLSIPKNIDPSVRAQLLVQLQRERLVKRQASLAPEQITLNKTKAQEHFTQAQELIQKGQAKAALAELNVAVKLDPENDYYFYAYAIAFYKVGRYRRSLAMLNILETSAVDSAERQYYEALNLYMLREYEPALEAFIAVRDQNDQVLSPLAAFYAGGVTKHQGDYAEARRNYEYVLDNSKNNQLDEKAENALFEITRLEQRAVFDQKVWGYTFFTGFMYDGNVLNVARNLEPSTGAYRAAYGGSLAYKAVFTEKRSWLPQVSVSDMYSVDDKFQANSELQAADPLAIEISAPYRQKVTFDKQPGVLTIAPAFQQLYMSIDQDGRAIVFNSAYLNTSLLLPDKKWSSEVRVEISRDMSRLAADRSSDDLTAWKTNVAFSQIRHYDDLGRKSLIFDFIYSKNRAVGENNRYYKYVLSVGGTRPITENWLGLARLDYLIWRFNEASELKRSDNGGILTFAGYYNLTAQSTLSLTAQYHYNQSSVEGFTYNKAVVGVMYSYRGGFF